MFLKPCAYKVGFVLRVLPKSYTLYSFGAFAGLVLTQNDNVILYMQNVGADPWDSKLCIWFDVDAVFAANASAYHKILGLQDVAKIECFSSLAAMVGVLYYFYRRLH